MAEIEQIITGREHIAQYMGWSVAKYLLYCRELHHVGAIFYQYMGRPSRKTACAFPGRLQKYLHIKSTAMFGPGFKRLDKMDKTGN